MSCRFSFTMKVIVERVEQRVVFSAVDREVLTGNVASLLRKYYFLIRFQPFLPPCFTILSAIHSRFLLCASLLNLVNASKMLRGSGNGEGHEGNIWEMFLGTGERKRERRRVFRTRRQCKELCNVFIVTEKIISVNCVLTIGWNIVVISRLWIYLCICKLYFYLYILKEIMDIY